MLITSPLYRRALSFAYGYRLLILVALAAALGEALLAGTFTKLMQPLVNTTFVQNYLDKTATLFPLVVVAIFAGRGILGYTVDVLMAKAGRSVARDMRTLLFGKCMRLPSHSLESEPVPSMLIRLGSDCDQLSQAVVDAVKATMQQSLQVSAMLAVMLWTSWHVAVSILLLAPPLTWVTAEIGKRYRRIGHHMQVSGAELHQSADQALSGHQEVKIYGAQAAELDKYAERASLHLSLGLVFESTRSVASAAVQLLAAVGLAVLLLIASFEASQGRLTAGAFVSLMASMMVLVSSLKQIAGVQGILQRGLASAERIFDVLDRPEEHDTGTRALTRSKGLLEFRNVSASYPNQTTPALSNVTFRAWPGSVTAIVGRSGSGKSTLAKLIARLYECTSGELLLDGYPIREYSIRDLRRQVAMVAQTVSLFDGTVSDNVAYGELGERDEGTVMSALDQANAMEFVRCLPGGEKTLVGIEGGNLSGGQRQRILLARAILKDAPILVLDEATASLDPESERLVQDALAHGAGLRTTLVIAHRLSTIERADQIVVLDHGRIVELGTHNELISKDGHYASLHRNAFRGSH